MIGGQAIALRGLQRAIGPLAERQPSAEGLRLGPANARGGFARLGTAVFSKRRHVRIEGFCSRYEELRCRWWIGVGFADNRYFHKHHAQTVAPRRIWLRRRATGAGGHCGDEKGGSGDRGHDGQMMTLRRSLRNDCEGITFWRQGSSLSCDGLRGP